MKTSIHHWRYEDGWHDVPGVLLSLTPGMNPREFREEIVGWHCWAYCDDHNEFMTWMEINCPTSDCTPRFNSGDPMVTVNITDKNEAAYFMLNFDV